MTIALVTGASGFTGSRLAHELARRGYDVRAMVRPESDAGSLTESGIRLVRADVRNADEVDRAVGESDVVFHLAALYRTARHSDEVYRQVNVEGTRNLLEAAQRHNVKRFVHCSTIGVHGDVKQIPADETTPFKPGDIYQATKLAGEQLVQQAIEQGMSAVVVRPSGIYGPGDRRFLKLFRMIKSRRFRMLGTGEVFLHLVYVDDLVDGFICCAEQAAAVGETYIVAGDRYVTLNELASQVAHVTEVGLRPTRLPYPPLWAAAAVCEFACRALSIEPPLHRRRIEFFVKNRAFSIAKATSELGFRPQVDLATGLQRTANWYCQKGWL